MVDVFQATRHGTVTRYVWRGAVAGILLHAGCTEDGIDYDDELGVGSRPEEAYELIVVDEGAGADTARSEPKAGEATDAGTDVRPRSVAEPPEGDGARGGDKAGISSPVEYDPEGEFTVQIGVYANARDAAARVRELDGLGYPAYAIARTDGKGIRVRIGYFKTRGDAQRFGEIFSQDTGSEFWIDRQTNEMY